MGQAPSSTADIPKQGPWSKEALLRLVGRLEADIRSTRTMCLSVHLPSVGRSVIGVPERHDIASTGALTALVRKLRRTCAVPVDLLLEGSTARVLHMQQLQQARPVDTPNMPELVALRREFERKEDCDNVRLLLSDMRPNSFRAILHHWMKLDAPATHTAWLLRLFLLPKLREWASSMYELLRCQMRRDNKGHVLLALSDAIRDIADRADRSLRARCPELFAAHGATQNVLGPAVNLVFADAVNIVLAAMTSITDCFTVAQLYRTDKPWRPVAICYGGGSHTVFTLALVSYIEAHGGLDTDFIDLDEVRDLAASTAAQFFLMELTGTVQPVGAMYLISSNTELTLEDMIIADFAARYPSLMQDSRYDGSSSSSSPSPAWTHAHQRALFFTLAAKVHARNVEMLTIEATRETEASTAARALLEGAATAASDAAKKAQQATDEALAVPASATDAASSDTDADVPTVVAAAAADVPVDATPVDT